MLIVMKTLKYVTKCRLNGFGYRPLDISLIGH